MDAYCADAVEGITLATLVAILSCPQWKWIYRYTSLKSKHLLIGFAVTWTQPLLGFTNESFTAAQQLIFRQQILDGLLAEMVKGISTIDDVTILSIVEVSGGLEVMVSVKAEATDIAGSPPPAPAYISSPSPSGTLSLIRALSL